MAKCEFSFSHSGDPDVVYRKASSAISDNGGEVSGNEKEGTFSIEKMGFSVEGTYTVKEKELYITIIKKPVFVSCKQIKELIQNSFPGNDIRA